MTQEDKQLLLKDLCARLPYGVKIHIDFNENGHIVGDATLNTITSITKQIFDFVDFEQDLRNGDCCPISGFGSNKHLHLGEFKPYLRPMSSMTDEEKEEFDKLINLVEERCINAYGKGGYSLAFTELNDWLNENKFDYHGLIPMGLALEAPEDMYKQ